MSEETKSMFDFSNFESAFEEAPIEEKNAPLPMGTYKTFVLKNSLVPSEKDPDSVQLGFQFKIFEPEQYAGKLLFKTYFFNHGTDDKAKESMKNSMKFFKNDLKTMGVDVVNFKMRDLPGLITGGDLLNKKLELRLTENKKNEKYPNVWIQKELVDEELNLES